MEPYQFTIDTATNGEDATIAIRSLEGAYYRHLPIVALTANALVGTRETFIRNGMNDFISKPIELNKLTKILQTTHILECVNRLKC